MRIAREGLRLFDTQGYEATTLEAVAKAAGVSARSLYDHFKKKYDILLFFHDDRFIVEIGPTLLRMSSEDGPLKLVRECLLALVPKYENDDPMVADRVWNSTIALRQRKQLIFLQIEAAVFDALGKIWPLPADAPKLKATAVIASGALRLAMEAGRQQKEHTPLRDRLEQSFQTMEGAVAR